MGLFGIHVRDQTSCTGCRCVRLIFLPLHESAISCCTWRSAAIPASLPSTVGPVGAPPEAFFGWGRVQPLRAHAFPQSRGLKAGLPRTAALAKTAFLIPFKARAAHRRIKTKRRASDFLVKSSFWVVLAQFALKFPDIFPPLYEIVAVNGLSRLDGEEGLRLG